ncbi:hypothetical protein [Gordonia sp. UCD-TK1]|uniref:hypothetical protein n=1 Tax=Gordonia sp. UCD-TK1 TaxID=1857893 RepID=UPI0011122C2B|nr:hypothetical protein [Gordonia sp. UCD-TK1]
MNDRSRSIDRAIQAVLDNDRASFDEVMSWPIDESPFGVPLFLRAAHIRCWAEDRFVDGFTEAGRQAELALRHYEHDLGAPPVESLGLNPADTDVKRGELATLYAYRLFSTARSERERISDGRFAAGLRALQLSGDIQRGDDGRASSTKMHLKWLFWAIELRTYSAAALGLVRDAALEDVRGEIEDAAWEVVSETVCLAVTATMDAAQAAAAGVAGLLQ